MRQQDQDNFDDGGTRAWRANQATWRREITIEPDDRWARWRALPFSTKTITLIFLVFFAIPFGYAACVAFLLYLHWLGIDPG